MKKVRFLCIALALCIMMTFSVSAAESSGYRSYTVTSYTGVVFTFEAARKVTRTIDYDDSVFITTEENAEVYLLKPGSSVWVRTPEGTETESTSFVYTLGKDGVYHVNTAILDDLRSGSSDTWFKRTDLVIITTEFITELREGSLYGGGTITWQEVVSEKSVYVMVDDETDVPIQPGQSETAFADVAPGAYYADSVAWAIEKGITNGTSATTFSPNKICTTAQILTFLWRAKGSPEPSITNPFVGLKDTDYYYKAALWAYENGLISGTDFVGDIPCTRNSTVTYLWKLAGQPEPQGANPFTDVSGDAKAVVWALEQGITSGTSATTFSPDATCTRAQIVTFLYRDMA